MQVKCYFPTEKQDHGHYQETPCIPPLHKKERGKHHGVVPVVDPAGAAAFILQEPGLKRAEKQNTYHIAHRVKKADKQKDTLINYIGKVERTDYAVENYPRKDNSRRGFFAVQLDFFDFCRNEIASELLLTAHAFKP